MKVALFVEGSQSPPGPRQRDALTRIWCEHLPALAGCEPFAQVHPISKQAISLLDPKKTRPSGSGESIDQHIARVRNNGPGFDAAVVAWDIEPPLATTPPLPKERCIRHESMWFREQLSNSQSLRAEKWPEEWRTSNADRLREIQEPPAPERPVAHHEIRFLCMNPEFEILLLAERQIRLLFGVERKRLKGWPGDWKPTPARRGKAILHEAIEAVRTVRPSKFPSIPGTIVRTAPNEWSEWLLRQLIADGAARETLANHPLVARLRGLMPRAVRR